MESIGRGKGTERGAGEQRDESRHGRREEAVGRVGMHLVDRQAKYLSSSVYGRRMSRESRESTEESRGDAPKWREGRRRRRGEVAVDGERW
jgi:hypothetical protein